MPTPRGKQVEIEHTPVNYAAGGAQLEQHLSGIDTALASGGNPTLLVLTARKGTGGTIAVGSPVYASGWNGGLSVVEVELADADAAALMPAIGLAATALTSAADGSVVTSGVLSNVDTSSWAVSDSLYVSTTAGTLTNVRPVGATAGIQRIGEVLRSHATLGQILVQGAGRTNDVSNIADGQIWEGDGTGVAVEVEPDGRYTPAAHVTSHHSGGGDPLVHDSIAGSGSNTHAQIDTHLGSTTNPHATDIENLGSGTLAELNSAVTDATLDDSGDSRPPNGAASGDLGGSYPSPTVNDGADSTAIHDNVAGEIAAIALKASPVGADMLVIEDSAAANAKKRVTVGSLAGGGDVTGPAGGTVAGNVALYDDTTGKVIRNSTVNIDATDNITGVRTIDLDLLGTPPSHGEGLVWYDSAAHALVAYNDISATTQQLGHEMYLRVYNDTGVLIPDGSAVYVSGVDTGRPTVALALASAYATAYAIGLTTHDIGIASEGIVTTFGGVSADTSGYSAGNTLYVSPTVAGALTTTAPVDGNIRVEVGRALDSAASGRIAVDVHGLPLDSDKGLNVPGDITCSTDGSTQSPVAPRIIGFTDLGPGAEAGRFQFGDEANGLQNGFDTVTQLYSYHTLHLLGDRQSASAPAFIAGTAEDIAVIVDNITAGDIALVVRADPAQSVSLQEWQTSAGTPLVAVTETGSIEMGGTATAGDLNLPDEGMIRSYGGAAPRVVARVEGSALFVGENGAAAATGAVATVDIEATTNVDISLTGSDTVVASFQATLLDFFTDIAHNNNDALELKTATFNGVITNAAITGNPYDIDWTDGQKQSGTVTGTATVTFTAPAGPCNLMLLLTNGSAFTVTWPATVQWPGGSPPSFTASGTDVVAFFYDGTNYWGVASLNLS